VQGMAAVVPAWGRHGMRLLASFATAALFGIALSESALAQSGRFYPECRTSRDHHACNCAIENGGNIDEDPQRPGRMRWRTPRVGTGAHAAFLVCVNRGGRY